MMVKERGKANDWIKGKTKIYESSVTGIHDSDFHGAFFVLCHLQAGTDAGQLDNASYRAEYRL